MSVKKTNKSNHCIEALRGGAILLVAVYHLLYKYPSSMVPDWAGLNVLQKIPLVNHWGEIGVSIFLVITSYFLYSSKKQRNFRIWDYYLNKLLRLWPAYFLAVSVTFIVSRAFPYPNYERTVLDYFLNITWINGYINLPYIDGSHWYMTVLISLIVVNGIIKKLKIDDRIETYIIWVSIAGVAKLVSQLLLGREITTYLALAFAGVYKILGGGYIGIACLCIVYHIIRDHNYSLGKAELFKCVVLFIVSSAYTVVATNIFRLIFTYISIVILEICLRKGTMPFKSRLALIAGAFSYPFYLIHQQLGYIVEFRLGILFNNRNYNMAFFAAALGISFLAALLIYVIVNEVEKLIRIKNR